MGRITLFEDGNAIEVHRITGLHKAHVHLYSDSDAPNCSLPVELDGNGLVTIGRVEAEFQTMGKPRTDKKNQKTLPAKMEKKKFALQSDVEYNLPAPMSRKQRLEARARFRDIGEKDRAATQAMASRSNLEAY